MDAAPQLKGQGWQPELRAQSPQESEKGRRNQLHKASLHLCAMVCAPLQHAHTHNKPTSKQINKI